MTTRSKCCRALPQLPSGDARSAEAWKEIPDIAEEVARGLRPTAIDGNGNIISGREIDNDQAQKAVKGDLRVGISSCRDVYDSPLPGQSPGRLCGAANRSCFFCPGSVVTPDDIRDEGLPAPCGESAHDHVATGVGAALGPHGPLDHGSFPRWTRTGSPFR